MTDKNIVYYDWIITRGGHGGTGDPVGHTLVAHPVNYPEDRVRFTTPVESYDETTGIYETLNTVYVPAGPADVAASSQA